MVRDGRDGPRATKPKTKRAKPALEQPRNSESISGCAASSASEKASIHTAPFGRVSRPRLVTPGANDGQSKREMPRTGGSKPEQAGCCSDNDELMELQSRTGRANPTRAVALNGNRSPSCTRSEAGKGNPQHELPCNSNRDSKLAASETGEARSMQLTPCDEGKEPVETTLGTDGKVPTRDRPLGNKTASRDTASGADETESG